MHLHLNPLGGLAGDMFCAALLDIRPDLLDGARRAIDALGLPVRLDLDSAAGLLSGRRFRVTPDGGPEHHPHRSHAEIRALLSAAELSTPVRDRALAIFARLAEAEGRVHQVDPDLVSFHEVGAWDSIGDIVTAAVLLDALRVDSTSSGPLPLGGGRVSSAHGPLPVPAPATMYLIEGLPVVDDGIGGERVTPTGAAILRSLHPVMGAPLGVFTGGGMGFGSRDLNGVPNCVQALLIDAGQAASDGGYPAAGDQVGVLRFDLDDQTGEELAWSLARLRETAGVLSATSVSAIGKQGRPTVQVELLTRPDALRAVARACFDYTTTLGLRWQLQSRLTLHREQVRVDLGQRELRVKRARRPGELSAKTEAADLAASGGADDTLERRRRRAVDAVDAALAGADRGEPDV